MEAVRDRFTAAELLSYKEVLYDETTEEWKAPHDPSGTRRMQLYAVSSTVLSPC